MTATAILLTILGVIPWGREHRAPGFFVFNSADEMAQVWQMDGGTKETLPSAYNTIGEIRVFEGDAKAKDEPPRVDFAKHMVVAAFLGEKRSGGYSISIEKLYPIVKDKRWLVVLYRETAPAPGTMQTRAIIYPSHVVVVPKFKYDEVKFINVESEEGRQGAAALKQAQDANK
jgi:hypothetical protein